MALNSPGVMGLAVLIPVNYGSPVNEGQPLKASLPVVEGHIFRTSDLVGGDLLLDFINTVTGRDVQARDWIAGYRGLIRWAALAQVVDGSTVRALTIAATKAPEAANEALVTARGLREALYAIFAAIADGDMPRREDLSILQSAWVRAAANQDFKIAGRRLVMVPATSGLSTIADKLAMQAVKLLAHDDLGRLRQCDGHNCGWLFLDASKGGRRRWCDMATCGNAAKSARHAERRKDALLHYPA